MLINLHRVLLSMLWLVFSVPLSLFVDAIIELHTMDEKMFNDFLLESEWVSYVIKVDLILVLILVHVVIISKSLV